MSVAEKSVISAENAQAIFENQQRVYDKGYTDGFNSAPPDYLPYVTDIEIQDLNLFGKETVELNLCNILSYTYTILSSVANTTVKHLIINGNPNKPVPKMNFFMSDKTGSVLKRLTLNFDLSECTEYAYMFNGLGSLEIVDGVVFDFSKLNNANGTTNMFLGCKALREFRVKPLTLSYNFAISSLANLSAETIQSIIDGLADLTGQTAQEIQWNSAASLMRTAALSSKRT